MLGSTFGMVGLATQVVGLSFRWSAWLSDGRVSFSLEWSGQRLAWSGQFLDRQLKFRSGQLFDQPDRLRYLFPGLAQVFFQALLCDFIR